MRQADDGAKSYATRFKIQDDFIISSEKWHVREAKLREEDGLLFRGRNNHDLKSVSTQSDIFMYPCLPQCSTERSELSPILAKPRSNVTVRDGFITAIGTGVTRCGVDFLGQVLGVALLLVVHRQRALLLGQLQSNVTCCGCS